MISIAFNRAGFSKEFQAAISRAKDQAGMLMVAGREVANQLKAWFRGRERTGANRLSPRRSHFWLQVARSVQNPQMAGASAVSVTVSDPRFAQKVFGGVIRAKRAGALTIPENEKAYGRTAATFERETGLKLFIWKGKTGGARRGQTGPSNSTRAFLAARVNGKIEIEYMLTPSVRQEADPLALPPQKDLEGKILARAQRFLEHEKKN